MRKRTTPTQPILVHSLGVGAPLLETDDHGNETRWCVSNIEPHPLHRDRLIVMGETGEVRDFHIRDWVRRVRPDA